MTETEKFERMLREGHEMQLSHDTWITSLLSSIASSLARIADAINTEESKALEQEPKAGHWIDTGSGQECSECHEIQYGYDSNRKYCANCGCAMFEPQESEDKE